QIEAELASLRSDAGRVLGCERSDFVTRLAWGHVVRLVDDDEDGLSLGASSPERREHGLRGDRLLGSRVERSQIDDEASRPPWSDEVLERAGIVHGPDRPSVQAQ